MNISLAFALALLLSGCTTHRMGRFINLETGEEVRVEAAGKRDGAVLLQGTSVGGRPVSGELWETRAFDPAAGGSGATPHPLRDTVFQGTGLLRDGDRILDFHYLRPAASTSAVGTATDNRGGRYKVVFWTAHKPMAAAVAGK